MDFFGELIIFAQDALAIIYDFGQRMLSIISREYTIGPIGPISIFELIFGYGLPLYIGWRLLEHFASLVIPN